METKELKIQIPDGYEIDKEKSTFEKIVFKKKEVNKPRNWEEYCRLQKNSSAVGYFINSYCDVSEKEWATFYEATNEWRYIIPSKELAEAFIAMMQLMSLRQAWIGDWKPDWSCGYSSNYCVVGAGDRFDVCILGKCRYALSFPTEEMAIDFINCFKDLLEIAKPLI